MTDIIGEAAYRIRADTSGFQAEAESGLLPAIKRIGGVLAAAFVAKKIFDFGKEAVTEAAKTQKAVESVRASFGKFSGSLIGFNENIATSLGVSNQVASEFSSQLGTLFDNVGIGNAKSLEMAHGLEVLGANMASIKGIDPAEVFNALGNSLAGSTRGLKQFGIVIGTADIQARAFKLGLIDTIDSALTPGAKAQAIYSLEMDQFGEIAKRAGKNQDDLANVTQRLGAEFDNIKEKIGTFLLPLIAQVGLVIEKQVIPFVTEWVDILQAKLGPAVDSIGGFLRAHADTIIDVAKAFVIASTATVGLGSAIETLSLSMELLTSPIGIVLALGTALVLAYQKVKVFHDAVDSLVGFLGSAFSGVVSAAKDAVETISDAFEAAGRHKQLGVQISIIWRGIKEAVSGLWDALVLAWEGGEGSRQRNPLKINGKDIQFDNSDPGKKGIGEQLKKVVHDEWEGIDWGGVLTFSGEDAGIDIDWGDIFSFSGLDLGDTNDMSGKITDWWQSAVGNVDWGGLLQSAMDFSGLDLLSSLGLDIDPGAWIKRFADAWTQNITTLPKIGPGLIDFDFGSLSAAFGPIRDSIHAIGAAWDFVREKVGGVIDRISSIHIPPTGAIDLLKGAWDHVSNAVSGLIGWIGRIHWPGSGPIDLLKSAWGHVSGAIQSVIGWIGKIHWPGSGPIDAIKSAWDGVVGAIQTVIGLIPSIDFPDKPSWLHLASGTPFWPGGPVWVGEQGPELVNLPTGSQVLPHRQSAAFAEHVSSAMRSSATVEKAVTIVHVHFDDPALKGLINVQIDNADQALANQIAAGTL